MEEKDIVKIALGIRYRRSFRIRSIVGEIVDYIINDEDSPFSDMFNKVGDLEKGQILLNEQTHNSLAIDIDNFVLHLSVDSNFQGILSLLAKEYYEYLEGILKRFNIQNYNRVGIVFEYKLLGVGPLNQLVNKLSNSTITSADNMEFKFSKRIPKTEALIKKEIVDYYNVNVIYLKNSDGLLVKLDYQVYFSPEIYAVQDIEFDKFLRSARSYLNQFQKWGIEV